MHLNKSYNFEHIQVSFIMLIRHIQKMDQVIKTFEVLELELLSIFIEIYFYFSQLKMFVLFC